MHAVMNGQSMDSPCALQDLASANCGVMRI
jgi:hypothetical protein